MKKIMLGNEAFAQGAYEAGCRVVSSYPGTPSTEVTEFCAKFDEMHVEWAPNEKVAMEVAIGVAIGGARALTCMKHVGLNVAADPLFTAAYTGVNAGLVVLVADDPGIFSSQNEQDSRFYARFAGIPMLEPSDSSEAKEYIKYAFALSEAYDTPVLVRSCTRLSHSRSVVEEYKRRERPLKDYVKDPKKYVMMPAMAKGRHIVQEQRILRLQDAAESDRMLNRIEFNKDELGVITSGTCYQYVKEMYPEASILKLGMVWPLPKEMINEFAASVKTIVVVEELEPFMEDIITASGLKLQDKCILSRQSEYTPNLVRDALRGIMDQKYEAPEYKSYDLPARPPVMCVGCPHRAVFHTLSKLGLTVTGDIGCYTLGATAPLCAIDTCVCMGASIGMAHGMELARGPEFAKQLVAVIGDSTFIHSGITGLINMVYNETTSTVIILDNSITGMTGHQDNPASGRNAKGQPAPQLDLEQLVRSVGVKHIVVIDPFKLEEFESVVKQETERGELSVIIAQRPCDLIVKKTAPVVPAKIAADKCVGCFACMALGCPALMKKGADCVAIDASQCNGCGLCAQVCPTGAITED